MLVIMAKAARSGTVKTRPAACLSPKDVISFYSCLLDDTLALARSLNDVELALMCPQSDVQELVQLTGNEATVVAQQGGGLAAALTSVFSYFTEDRQRRVIAFNSDSPHLPRSVLEQAFERLTTEDLVVWPTDDGGYYLIGAEASHPTLFPCDGLGTSSALERLLSRIRHLNLSVGFVDPSYDIDVPDDMARLGRTCVLLPIERRVRRCGFNSENMCGATRNLRTKRFTSSTRVYALGSILCVAQSFCAYNSSDRGGALFLASLSVAGVTLSIGDPRLLVGASGFPRVIVVGLSMAALSHFLSLRMPPRPDHDVYRYV